MPSTDPTNADLLVLGGPIYTQDPDLPVAGALATRADRILAVGQTDDLESLCGPGTRVLHLEGRAVVPGFVDAHVHFGDWALSRLRVNLDATRGLEDALPLLRQAAERLPSGTWLLGRGWDRNRWRLVPTAADLDRAVGDRPAALSSHDGHSLWLSSAAIAAAGLGADTPDPPGGRIERDGSGRPSGVLFENAQDLLEHVYPRTTANELAHAIHQALPVAAAAGITGIHNIEGATSLRAFSLLRRRQALTLRVFHCLPRENLAAAAQLGLETGLGDDWLRIGLVKIFSDGALGSQTGYMLEPYEGRVDGYRGIATIEPDDLRADLQQAARAGLGVAVHAIGDAAVRGVLDAFEWLRASEPAAAESLLRVEHAQIVHPDDLPRFRHLRVVASMQPIHATSDWRAADTYWGSRSRYAYAWRALLDAGALLAFGTDAPVERIEPLTSLYAAVTRRDPEGQPPDGWYPHQRLTLNEAIRAYTLGSAEAEGAAAQRGTLAPGKLADIVVLSQDPFPAPPEALLETHVDLTVVGGTVVYER